MAVSTKKLVYDFRRKYDSINTGAQKDIALTDVIAYLNEAQEIWYENRVFVAQTHQKVRNDIRAWKVDKVKLPCITLDKGCCKVKYPDNLYHRLNQIAVVTKDCCPNRSKEIIPRIIQSDDLHEARLNPFRKPNYFFEQLLAIEASDGLLIYHDGEMSINETYLDYYRKLNELHAPSLEECDDGGYYYDYNGSIINNDLDFESDNTYSAGDIVDIAVLSASRDTGDVQGFQTQINLILQKQQLHR